MQINWDLIVGATLCFLPVFLAVATIYVYRKNHMEIRRFPFDELKRRPAGETLRRELEFLDEKINDAILGLLLVPAFLTCGFLYTHPQVALAKIIFFSFSGGGACFFGYRLYRLLQVRTTIRQGYEGERYVGEELSRLIRLGFEIYHDVPFDGFNIDHVMVGPRGVFVVETKTYSKPINDQGKKKYEVGFDGKLLHWPWGASGKETAQAKSNAKTLAGWLGSATGETVWVTPILTLPGWMVELKTPNDGLYVLNPKQIYKACAAQPEKLAAAQIQRICHQLDQKCRIAVS